ncbi:transcriptional regulator [Chryseobacterium sp. FH1]|uniref:helix-turn-helix transcriptional regulator n=1 Tax=Chryseobacterium sp. FH1 TaxID=1233951 RepID=UPI0004E37F85|nr:helix-turn-helix domain-containing protein [Chryseobacterium sp. FH1]KFC20743.1 plasmid maintenance system antidote protein [Chryseobacterium sp. FH1]
MKSLIKYKGIHPGIVLERELEKRSLKKRPFALSIGESAQTINNITNGKRKIPIPLALKIEKELQLEEGSIVILQSYYDIKIEKDKMKETPKLSVDRRSLFWDTDVDKIDWIRQHKAVINRVFERGNDDEKNEIIRFYGKRKVETALKSTTSQPMKLHKKSR